MTRWILMLAVTAALAFAACSDDAKGKTKYDFFVPDLGAVDAGVDGATDTAPPLDSTPPVDTKPATDTKKQG